jgi:hypothetical protein
MKSFLVSVVFCSFLFGCAPVELITGEGGPITFYYIDNQSSQDLYIYSSFYTYGRVDDTLLISPDSIKNFGKVGAFLNRVC